MHTFNVQHTPNIAPMKKTLTVNIDGIVFHIDEDAYNRLRNYLDTIRYHFQKETGCEEIISGIESRIAEMFQEKRKTEREVVSLTDVNEAIAQLGEPEQISGTEEEHSTSSASGQQHSSYQEETGPKRLFRSPDDKYIGGVCGGLGTYFQIDPTWIRVFFLLTIFAYSFGIILYIILWIAIPKARTMAERLSMRGEKVTLSSIEKSIKEDLEDIKKNLENMSKKDGAK